MDFLALCFFAFLAGFVDSVVGGGGLIQLPAVLVFMPGASETKTLAPIWGTNKFSAFCGASMAVGQYVRRVRINWPLILPASGVALIFSFIGSRAVSHFHRETIEPLILLLMIGVAAYTFAKKNFGNLHAPKWSQSQERLLAMAVGMVMGFYDGFFGPGTGSFLIFIFIGLFGFDFLNASAHAKIINFTTNLASVVYFSSTGNIFYKYALAMGACNLTGSAIGSRLALLKGNSFVRLLFLVVVSGMILRFGWQIVRR